MATLDYSQIARIIQGNINFDFCQKMDSAEAALYWLNNQDITEEMVKVELEPNIKDCLDYISERMEARPGLTVNEYAARYIVDDVCCTLLKNNNMYFDERKNPNGFWLETVTFTLD